MGVLASGAPQSEKDPFVEVMGLITRMYKQTAIAKVCTDHRDLLGITPLVSRLLLEGADGGVSAAVFFHSQV